MNIKDHSISRRIKVIQIQETELDKLIFPFNKHSIQSLEYKPFSRFSLAKKLQPRAIAGLSTDRTDNKPFK